MRSLAVRSGVLALCAATFCAAPVGATPVTLDFAGTVDLTPFGGSASNTFNGSVTWDTATLPFFDNGTSAEYPFETASFFLNSTDLTANIRPPDLTVLGSLIDVSDGLGDQVTIVFGFSSPISVGIGPSINGFGGYFLGPQTMLSSRSLPDLGFLNLARFSFSDFEHFMTDPINDPPVGAHGTLQAVPEPASLILVATSIGVLASASRNSRRQSNSNEPSA